MLFQGQPNRWLTGAGVLLGFLSIANPWPVDSSLPLRECLVLGLAVAVCLPELRARRLTQWPGAGLTALLAVVLIALSGVRAPSAARAVAEVTQFAGYVLLLPVLLQRRSVSGAAIATGLCVGATANVCVLGLAGPWTRGWNTIPTLDNRLIYGVTLAAVIPFALLLLQPATSRGRTLLSALGALTAGLTVTSLPAGLLCLLSLTVALWRWCRPRRTALALLAAWVAGMALTALLINPAGARRSLAWRDAHGQLRRWAQEDIAAWRAVLDAPLRGHGIGRYQETVSAGLYRRDLPRPSETKVEPGMEPGLLVLAVESGLPTALAVLALFAAAAWRRRQQAAGAEATLTAAAGHGVLCLGAGLFLTLIHARSGGLLCGVLLGLARRTEDKPEAPRGPRALTQAGIFCLALAAMLLCRHLPARSTGNATTRITPAAPEPNAIAVVLSADDAIDLAPGVQRVTESGTAAPQILYVPDLAFATATPERLAAWRFSTPRQARVTLWFRVWWQDGCGNSLAAAVDAMTPSLVGNDGTYKAWHWVRGFDLDLAAGTHVLSLAPREDGIRLDQVLITSAKETPLGLLGPDGGADKPADTPAPGLPTTAVAALVARQQPFLVGVGGCYRGGFEAALLAMGLPWSKVNDSDLTRPERLTRFNVICLSETKEVAAGPMYRTLQDYVANGGVLVHENCTGPVPEPQRSSLLFFPTPVRWRPYQAYGATLATDASAFFAVLPAGSRFNLRDDVPYMVQQGSPGAGWSGHGTVLVYGRDDGAAIWERQVGKGRVIYCRIPLSFHTMWRGPELLPVLKSLLGALTRDCVSPIAPLPEAEPPAGPQDSLSDDFMRVGPELGPSWVVSGTATCTGERGPEPHTEFSLRLEAGARARASQTFTTDWTVSAAVLPEQGTGGIWLTVAGGEVRLIAAKDGEVRLEQQHGDQQSTVGRTPLPGGGGWHRLSLSQRGTACEAFVDGEPTLRVADLRRQDAAGSFGVLCEGCHLFVDDVTGRPSAGVLHGTDRYLGDEGSPQAWGGLSQGGIERSTVYSLQWNTQASPLHANAIVLGLPNYLPGELLRNGTLATAVGPNTVGAAVALDDASASLRSIAFACPGWRDYVFCGRQTDWFGTGADWVPLSRWSCDPEWYWLGAETHQRAALWYRQRLAPPYAISALVSVGARNHFSEEYSRGRDMDLALGATETDVTSGVTVRVMNAADRGIEAWQGGVLLKQFKDIGLPSGHSLHHNWFEVTAVAEAGRLRVRFDGRELGDVPLPQPLRPGRAAVWTENNSIRVARVTLSLSTPR